MATLRKQIVDVVILALNTGRPAGMPEATRLRQSQVETDEQPSISVYPGDESIQPATNRPAPLVVRQLQVFVEARANGDEPDVLLDPLLAWIEQAVTSATSVLWHDDVQATHVHHEYTIGVVPHGHARVTFVVPYQTRRNDPEAAA